MSRSSKALSPFLPWLLFTLFASLGWGTPTPRTRPSAPAISIQMPSPERPQFVEGIEDLLMPLFDQEVIPGGVLHMPQTTSLITLPLKTLHPVIKRLEDARSHSWRPLPANSANCDTWDPVARGSANSLSQRQIGGAHYFTYHRCHIEQRVFSGRWQARLTHLDDVVEIALIFDDFAVIVPETHYQRYPHGYALSLNGSARIRVNSRPHAIETGSLFLKLEAGQIRRTTNLSNLTIRSSSLTHYGYGFLVTAGARQGPPMPN